MIHKVLSIQQPWAGLILLGNKQVENRSWPPGKRLIEGKRLMVHASKKIDQDAFSYAPAYAAAKADESGICKITGHIIGSVNYMGCVSNQDDPRLAEYDPQRLWYFGKFGWLFSNPEILEEPIEIGGMLTIWNYDDGEK